MIKGNVIGGGSPSPDWLQTDSTKPDFIKNKDVVNELVESRQAQHVQLSLTLPVSGWNDNTQTVECAVAENDGIVIGMASGYEDYQIYASAQEEGALTFVCKSVPNEDVVVNVLILPYGEGQSGGNTNAVLYIPQDLTDDQKEQARKNIGIGVVETIDFTNWDNGSFTEVVDGETITHTVVTGENTITIDGVVITFPEDA